MSSDHRLDGDLLLATGGPADEAAARYHRALAIAREQGACYGATGGVVDALRIRRSAVRISLGAPEKPRL